MWPKSRGRLSRVQLYTWISLKVCIVCNMHPKSYMCYKRRVDRLMHFRCLGIIALLSNYAPRGQLLSYFVVFLPSLPLLWHLSHFLYVTASQNCHSGPRPRKESHYPLAKPYNWEWRTSEYVLESVLYPSSRYITPNLCMGVFRPWWCRSEEKEALLYIQHHMCGRSHTSFYLIW